MGTNFYWRDPKLTYPDGTEIDTWEALRKDSPVIHIGKRVKAEKGLAFLWAQDPGRVHKILAGSKEEPVVVDEYGTDYTPGAFLEAVNSAATWDTSSIGEEFS